MLRNVPGHIWAELVSLELMAEQVFNINYNFGGKLEGPYLVNARVNTLYCCIHESQSSRSIVVQIKHQHQRNPRGKEPRKALPPTLYIPLALHPSDQLPPARVPIVPLVEVTDIAPPRDVPLEETKMTVVDEEVDHDKEADHDEGADHGEETDHNEEADHGEETDHDEEADHYEEADHDEEVDAEDEIDEADETDEVDKVDEIKGPPAAAASSPNTSSLALPPPPPPPPPAAQRCLHQRSHCIS